MNDFIEAMMIFERYMTDKNAYSYKYPFFCDQEQLSFCGKGIENFSQEDIDRLEVLGFDWDSDADCWISNRFGSC